MGFQNWRHTVGSYFFFLAMIETHSAKFLSDLESSSDSIWADFFLQEMQQVLRFLRSKLEVFQYDSTLKPSIVCHMCADTL